MFSHRWHGLTQMVRVRGDVNNGLNRLNGFLLLGIFNNGLNRLNGFYSSGGILPPPRPSYIRAIRGRNILDVRGRPQNTLNTRKTIAERWTNTNYANKANNSSPTDGGWTQMLGCAEMNNGLRMWLSVAEVSGLRITKSAFVRYERFVFEKNA